MKVLIFKDDFVTIETSQSERGYIIKDKNNMITGKIEIIEYSHQNRNCTFRLHSYIGKGNYEYVIKMFINMLFNNADLFKINVLIKEGLDIQPFFNLNFHIEGIITNNSLIDCKYNNEILLGIDYEAYRNLKKVTELTLNGDNIYLKILNTNDANILLNYYKKNREHLRTFEELKDENFYTLEGQTILIRQQYIKFLNGNSAFFGIFKNKIMIGVINLYNIMGGMFKNATVGYSIDEAEQGKGYMKEAVNIINDYAFNTLKLHRIQATTLTNNIKSKSVLKACGFKEIGISEKYLFINGKWQDQCILYKLNVQEC